MIDIYISVLSLAVSAYAVFRNRQPGPQGPIGLRGFQGPAGPQGLQGIQGISGVISPSSIPAIETSSAEVKYPGLTSKDILRREISERASDPDLLKRETEIRDYKFVASGTISPDSDAPTNPAVWRKRLSKKGK